MFGTCECQTNVKFEISASNYTRVNQNLKTEIWRLQRSFDLDWPRLTSGLSQGQCKSWKSPRITYSCAYHRQKCHSWQVTGMAYRHTGSKLLPSRSSYRTPQGCDVISAGPRQPFHLNLHRTYPSSRRLWTGPFCFLFSHQVVVLRFGLICWCLS